MPLPRYIPAGSVKVSSKVAEAVAYLYTSRKGRAAAVIYLGKQGKAAAHYSYMSEAARSKSVAAYFQSQAAKELARAERSAQRKAWVNNYQVGEIVGTCWGYEQTNREYYEIIAVKGKRVTLRQVACASYETAYMAGKAAPLPGQYIGEPFARLAQERGIKINEVAFATRTAFTEVAPGVRVYEAGYVSSYA